MMERYCKILLCSVIYPESKPWLLTLSLLQSRYLRARKFDIAGAIGQFTDTEKWMKEQGVVELYDHFDVDFYEHARLMVSAPFQSCPQGRVAS